MVTREPSFSLSISFISQMKRSFKLILQDFLQFSFVTLIFSFFISCGSNQETDTDSPMEPDKDAIEVNEGDSARFISKDRKKEEILADYEKPLVTYPTISSDESDTGADGLVYREGIETPYTGRIIDRFESGEIKMDSSYLVGQPHGMQVRYYDNGKPALEASFDNGRLSGIKSRWWENGLIREEEYWSEGKYRGRRLWDESGRLTKEEILP
jgi:hypothetical protein